MHETTANQRDALGRFKPGNKFAPGGVRPNSGRKTQSVIEARQAARDAFEQAITGDAEKLGRHFIRRAYKSDKVLIKAADILLPDEQTQNEPARVQILIGVKVSANADALHALAPAATARQSARLRPFPLIVNNCTVALYIADFAYIERGELIVEDVKGHRTDVYKLKRKIFEAQYGMRILET